MVDLKSSVPSGCVLKGHLYKWFRRQLVTPRTVLLTNFQSWGVGDIFFRAPFESKEKDNFKPP